MFGLKLWARRLLLTNSLTFCRCTFTLGWTLWHFGVHAPAISLKWRKDEAWWGLFFPSCRYLQIVFTLWISDCMLRAGFRDKVVSSLLLTLIKSTERSSWMWWFTAETVKHQTNLEGCSCFDCFDFLLSAHRGGQILLPPLLCSHPLLPRWRLASTWNSWVCTEPLPTLTPRPPDVLHPVNRTATTISVLLEGRLQPSLWVCAQRREVVQRG